ncbi:metalloregulator ArsR/SmtB family transcription factor [Streptomyces sp. NPDC005820]|uniref:ArsR/SmtB family transcription factor n=1 Tax=Streptomyces sp. NPDC005820 TaxID=3157069 RepID=UPI0033ED033A
MPPDVFGALANPVRRQLLDALRDGPRAVNDLAGSFALSRPAISEHLQVLRHAHLVREEPRGRQRFYHLEPAPLAEVGAWLHPFEHYWRTRMSSLADVLDEQSGQNEQNTTEDPPS